MNTILDYSGIPPEIIAILLFMQTIRAVFLLVGTVEPERTIITSPLTLAQRLITPPLPYRSQKFIYTH
jgi:hypothetical protein